MSTQPRYVTSRVTLYVTTRVTLYVTTRVTLYLAFQVVYFLARVGILIKTQSPDEKWKLGGLVMMRLVTLDGRMMPWEMVVN